MVLGRREYLSRVYRRKSVRRRRVISVRLSKYMEVGDWENGCWTFDMTSTWAVLRIKRSHSGGTTGRSETAHGTS